MELNTIIENLYHLCICAKAHYWEEVESYRGYIEGYLAAKEDDCAIDDADKVSEQIEEIIVTILDAIKNEGECPFEYIDCNDK